MYLQYAYILCFIIINIKYLTLSVWFQNFCSFMFLCPILLVIGVDLLQFLGIWFLKAMTEESFSPTRTKFHSLQEGIGLIM